MIQAYIEILIPPTTFQHNRPTPLLMKPIHYDVRLFDTSRHLLLVTMRVDASGKDCLPDTLSVALPAWIPGSYMVRDFARNVTEITAQDLTKKRASPLKLSKTDKHSWQLDLQPNTTSVSISMLIYAWDLSVRGAHFDQTHCFFNGTSVFLKLRGFEHFKHTVSLHSNLPELRDWRIATSMPHSNGLIKTPLKLSASATTQFSANDYDELIDHPFEIGNFQHASFRASGALHHVVVTGKAKIDHPRLCADLKRICEAQIQFFEPLTKKPPYKDYWFLVMAVGDGYGGLEHRASTALICSRNDLPYDSMPSLNREVVGSAGHDGYQTFLGLASHEFFHTWNVKRIRPKTFAPYDLDKEHYTRLLWIFEGFTSYYDDLFLVRTGLIDEKTYLKTLAKTLSGVQKTPGRLRQSVADSSFDAWTKYYKQDENSVNAIVSYYTKGSLVALALDLTIRARTAGSKAGIKSLDEVMRLMWQNYKLGKLVDENDFVALVEEATGIDVFLEVQRWAYGTEDIAWQPILAELGLELHWSNASDDAVWLGAKLSNAGAAGLTVQNAVGHGPLAKAGISAGDTLIAIDGVKASDSSLKALQQRAQPKEIIQVHAFRRDELMTFNVQLAAPPLNDAEIKAFTKRNKQQHHLFVSWLQK
jgi:predicted metalloprotease with PDZ domain